MNSMLRPCDTHFDLFNFSSFPNFKQALKCNRKVKVVATASSSTVGADGIAPYPPKKITSMISPGLSPLMCLGVSR
jgi:hypothetical protein